MVANQLLDNLVREHLKDTKTPMLLAVQYEADDPTTVCVLEVCRGVVNPGDASWDTFEFAAPPDLQRAGTKKLLLTYIGPDEFFQALEQPGSHGHELLMKVRKARNILFEREDDAEAQRISEALTNGHAEHS
ncbi:MAG: hypothetical protein AB1714_14210 [Acidobacteriota bacterium]